MFFPVVYVYFAYIYVHMCICLVTEEMEASDVSHHVDAGTGIKPWSSKRAVSALTSSATSQFLTGLQETSTAADYYPS